MNVAKAKSTGSKIPTRSVARKGGGQNVSAPMDSVKPPDTDVNAGIGSELGAIEEMLCELEQHCINSIQEFFKTLRSQQFQHRHRTSRRRMGVVIGAPPDISRNEIIRPRDLPLVTGLSKTNIWRLEKAGDFVPKLRLSNGCVGYSRESIQEWLNNRLNKKENINE